MFRVIKSMIGTLPQYADYAGEFCMDYRDYLMDSRSQGLVPEVALNELVYSLLLSMGEKMKETNDLTKILIAYSSAVIYKTPLSPSANLFVAAYEHLSLPIEFNPYSKDSYARWQKQLAT